MSDSKPRILVTGATGQRKLLAIIFGSLCDAIQLFHAGLQVW
jgi:hypothetical protein